jgi:cytoskeletal protein CcmA (bactofilin family)
MLRHIYRGLAICLLGVLMTVMLATPVMAFDGRTGDTVVIGSGEVIDDDLYVAGSTVSIDGTVNGDVLAVGNKIIVNGRINGDLIAAGASVTVNGEVTGAVRIAGATLEVKGNVGGDVAAVGKSLSLASTAGIGNDLVVAAANASIDSPVGGDIFGGGGEITLSNTVGGNVKLSVDSLTLLYNASIGGDLIYTSPNEADIKAGAQIVGAINHKLPPPEEREGGIGIGGKIVGFLMALALGIVIIVLAPKRMLAITDAIRNQPWHSLGWGAVLLFVTPIAALIVCLTVVGVPIGLIGLALYGIAVYISHIITSLLIGRLIIGTLRRMEGAEGRGILIGSLALGLVILTLLTMIPYIGFFVGLAAVLFGFGAILVAERQLRA